MRNGAVMSVGMVGLGWHWYPYRYSRTVDDGDGRPALPFPEELGGLAGRALADAAAVDGSLDPGAVAYAPDVALVNWYGPGARMGMHADTDEVVERPVVSVSVGDTGIFRWGNGSSRGRPWVDVPLESGDVFVFGGAARRAYHGLPRVLPGTAPAFLGPVGGRLNVTVRQTGLP
jgi:alkylated DNA repair protein (DNA oxidative demethylase)